MAKQQDNNDLETPDYSLAERIKFLRGSRKLSQAQLAKNAGLAQSTIAHIEKGRKDPSVATLMSIAKALDVDIATLFASRDVHVFDMPRLRRKYDDVERLTPHIYMAVGKIIQYARDIGFIKG